jgi:hypothetical protein
MILLSVTTKPGARVTGFGGFVNRDAHAQADAYIPRPNSAPAYYQGRPASFWINVMKPRRRGPRSPR